MSAIFGIIDFSGRHIPEVWKLSMQEDLQHRGPDGRHHYDEPGVLLGHMLLKVSPEAGHDINPYCEDDLVIVAHARLDARVALMNNLEIDLAQRVNITDTMLLFRAYKKWGSECVKQIYGDFAFAIWDKEHKQLFCARDAIGVKPLFYYVADNIFVFSTEVKALVNLPFVNTQLNHVYLRNRSIAICDQPADCAWTNIKRLMPAYTLQYKNGTADIKQYWRPRYKRNPRFKTAAESADAVSGLLKEVIADHTRVSGNVGASLSGGLDSSTICCVAAQQLQKQGKPLITSSSVYKPGFNNPGDPDEMEYINAVLEQEKNIVPTFVYHSDHSFVQKLDEKFRRNYAPVNAFYYVDEALYHKFEQKGVRRVLSGYLGDLGVTNSSINPFAMLIGAGRLLGLKKLLSEYKNARPQQTIPALIKNSILTEFLPGWFQRSWKKFRQRPMVEREVKSLPLQLSDEEQNVLEHKLAQTFYFPSRSPADIVLHVWPGTVYLFDEEEDCAASHHHLEVSYPLCDRRLIELILQLPPEHFYAYGFKRGLIRAAMAGILPEKVRTRMDKGSYAPGYTSLIKAELPQIKKIADTIRLTPALIALVDEQKLNSALKNLSESNLEDSFTYRNWTLIEIIIWIQCTKSLEKVKYDA